VDCHAGTQSSLSVHVQHLQRIRRQHIQTDLKLLRISSSIQKLCSLQLHLLGYDQVPTALRDIYDIVIERLEDLDIRSL
jgi:hypothetical protein